MAEEVGLRVKVTTVGQKGAMDQLKNETAQSVQQGTKTGMSSGAAAGVKDITRMLPASLRNAMSGATKILSSIKLPAVTMSAPVDQLSKAMEGATGTWAKGMASSLQAAADKTVFGFKVSDFQNVQGLAAPQGVAGAAEKAGGALGNLKLPAFLGGGGASAGGAAGAMGAMAGAAAAGVIVLQGILQAVQAVVSRLSEASPLLGSMLKQLNVGFNMILKPIGDVLGYLLRPIARFFMVIGRNMNMAMAEKVAEMQAQGITSGPALAAGMFASLPEILLSSVMDAMEGIDWDSAISQYVRVVSDNLTRVLPSLILTIAEALRELSAGVLMWLGEALYNALSGLGSWLWGGITGALGGAWSLLSGFGGWLWDSIKNAIGNLGSALGDLGNFVWKKIHNAIAGAFNAIHNFNFSVLGQTIAPFQAVPTIPYLASGGITNGPTLAMIGEGRRGTQREVVSPLSDLPRLLGLDRQQQQQTLTPPKIEVIVKGDLYGDNIQRKIEEGVERAIYRARGV